MPYTLVLILLSLVLYGSNSRAAELSPVGNDHNPQDLRWQQGRRMYRDGVLPSGQPMTATIQGDIQVTGEQMKCGACHRRSGMGSSEGQDVVPAVTGALLFKPLQIPTDQPPAPPVLRPAYTRESLKQAILEGVNANGDVMNPVMPRYRLTDDELDSLIDYLNTLSTIPSPGVTTKDIHFATIIDDSLSAEKRKALLDVLRVFFAQKNGETRHESMRAEHAPWHKVWRFKPYRKWILHVWELHGPSRSWRQQLEDYYQQTPVFAVMSGSVEGSWAPIHRFCEAMELPCLFPTTLLPLVSDNDFYSLYMNKGMILEGEGIARHIQESGSTAARTIQIFRRDDLAAATAGSAFKEKMKSLGLAVQTLAYDSDAELPTLLKDVPSNSVFVLWMKPAAYEGIEAALLEKDPKRVYLSTSLFGTNPRPIAADLKPRIYFIHTKEMPERLRRLLMRSTRWLKIKRIYAPTEQEVQANAYFAMKVGGDALRMIRGYFFRDYFIEKIEHIVDNAPYTSVYPRIGLAPEQRFVSKGYYIAKIEDRGGGGLTAITKWTVP